MILVRMSGAQALVEALKREKVQHIFGIPGGAIMPVYDILLDSDIRHILARHEQSAAHMADGYARASGRVGVCMATSGPGATNLVTGLLNANMDSYPVVAITGQVNTKSIGTDSFQEADIIGITDSATKYSFQPRSSTEIPRVVKEAFYIASTGRPGAVLIDLPRDVQLEVSVVEFPDTVSIRGYRHIIDPDPLEVKRATEALIKAERPFILAGGGVTVANAFQELLDLAEFLSAPVATTLMGKGCFPENHPLSLGTMGMHGQEANLLIQEADVVLAVGSRFSDRTTGWQLEEFCKDATLIHVDIDPSEIGKNKRPDLSIIGDAKRVLAFIYEILSQTMMRREKIPWLERINRMREDFQAQIKDSGREVTPMKILKAMREILPADAIVTTEVGQNQMWAGMFWKALKPRTFITSGGLGTMGFGFPASIGAKVARPDVPVVDIAGDGSFRMTENSLATSVMEEIPVIVVILDNTVLGMVAQWQRLFFKGRYSAVKLGECPDFVKLAEAYGAHGIRVGSIQEFSKALREALRSDVTTVIDIPIWSEENVLPMIPPGRSITEMIFG
jgi:acetolactate synthase-1/2/3 large subunit